MKQVVIGGSPTVLNTGVTEYEPLMGARTWSATEEYRYQGVSAPGTITKLRVELSAAPGSGANDAYIFTLMVDGAPTALTCTITQPATSAEDGVHSVAITAGQTISLRCEPSNTPDATPYAQWSTIFTGTNAKESNLFTGGQAKDDGITRYSLIMANVTAGAQVTEANVYSIIPTNGTIKNLYVKSNIKPDAGQTIDVVVRISSGQDDQPPTMGDTALEIQLTDADDSANDTAHDVAVLAGDVVTIAIRNSGVAVTTRVAIGLTFLADTDGESIMCRGVWDDLDDTDTEHNFLLYGYAGIWTVEANRQQLAQECVFKKFYVALAVAPGADNDYVFTVRQNTASPGSGLVVTIADAATSGNDTANTIAISDGDNVGLMVVPTGTPITGDSYWGMVCFIAAAGWTNIGKVMGATATDLGKVNGAAVADLAKLCGAAV